MRMLYFTTAYNAALLDRVHEEFLLRWQELGHEACILVPDPNRERQSRWLVEDGAIKVYRPAVSMLRSDRVLNNLGRRLTEYSYFFSLLRDYLHFLRQHPEIELIHVESVYPLGAIAALASLVDGRPFVPTIRGGDLIADDSISYGFARYKRVQALLKLTFARAAAIRSVSPSASAMAKQFGCPEQKIITIGRNIRDEYFERDQAAFRAESRAWLRQTYPAIAGRKVIVAAGRLLPVKGFDDLIRAMVGLPQAVAIICGPNRVDEKLGDYGEYLTQLAQDYGVADRIILTGGIPREQMPQYFAGADVLAVPSIIEGGNRTVLEAATLGVPFVATRSAGTPEFFSAAAGINIDPHRPDQLWAGLTTILAERREQAQARSQRCQQEAQQFYSPQVAQRLATLYAAILAKLPISGNF
ncbi:glycosyltransferase [Herpetosiphon sp. NSE202]|uniref:glycosyltransferase n=1 Tax=Herpetosiphon sp. NSE202 TaxID=3351349 RepID=UPI003627EEAD